MPIFFVDDSVLRLKLECVVCPVKISRFYLRDDLSNKIYSYAGTGIIKHLYDLVRPDEYQIPVMTDGVYLSKRIIHVIVSDLNHNSTFKTDLFVSYREIFKLIVKNKFQSVVLPPLYFSFKRLGNMYSYKTLKAFMEYFMKLYQINSNIYIMIDKQTIQDHLNNYVSSYESTSFPMSKRHKPTVYPFKTFKELQEFVLNNEDLLINKEEIINVIGPIEAKNPLFLDLYWKIKAKFLNDYEFCFQANISFKDYQDIFSIINFTPSKYVLLPICITLKMDVVNINKFLIQTINSQLNDLETTDKIVIDCLNNNIYDVWTINEKCYLQNCQQLGSYVPADSFKESSLVVN